MIPPFKEILATVGNIINTEDAFTVNMSDTSSQFISKELTSFKTESLVLENIRDKTNYSVVNETLFVFFDRVSDDTDAVIINRNYFEHSVYVSKLLTDTNAHEYTCNIPIYLISGTYTIKDYLSYYVLYDLKHIADVCLLNTHSTLKELLKKVSSTVAINIYLQVILTMRLLSNTMGYTNYRLDLENIICFPTKRNVNLIYGDFVLQTTGYIAIILQHKNASMWIKNTNLHFLEPLMYDEKNGLYEKKPNKIIDAFGILCEIYKCYDNLDLTKIPVLTSLLIFFFKDATNIKKMIVKYSNKKYFINEFSTLNVFLLYICSLNSIKTLKIIDKYRPDVTNIHLSKKSTNFLIAESSNRHILAQSSGIEGFVRYVLDIHCPSNFDVFTKPLSKDAHTVDVITSTSINRVTAVDPNVFQKEFYTMPGIERVNYIDCYEQWAASKCSPPTLETMYQSIVRDKKTDDNICSYLNYVGYDYIHKFPRNISIHKNNLTDNGRTFEELFSFFDINIYPEYTTITKFEQTNTTKEKVNDFLQSTFSFVYYINFLSMLIDKVFELYSITSPNVLKTIAANLKSKWYSVYNSASAKPSVLVNLLVIINSSESNGIMK